jgi:phage baseplate assembly protein gpV
MLRYGLISEVDYSIGRARVNFDDLEIVSDWLTLPKNIKENRYFEVNMQVAVLMHDNGEDGEIIHEVPADDVKPPLWASENVEGIEFKDGTKVTYDNSTKKLTIDAGLTGELIFNCAKLTVSGDIVGQIAGIGNVSLLTHVHASIGAPPTPTP